MINIQKSTVLINEICLDTKGLKYYFFDNVKFLCDLEAYKEINGCDSNEAVADVIENNSFGELKCDKNNLHCLVRFAKENKYPESRLKKMQTLTNFIKKIGKALKNNSFEYLIEVNDQFDILKRADYKKAIHNNEEDLIWVYELLVDTINQLEESNCYNYFVKSDSNVGYNSYKEMIDGMKDCVKDFNNKELQLNILVFIESVENLILYNDYPGVSDELRKLNHNINYYDASFTILEESEENYIKIMKGEYQIGFNYTPKAGDFLARKEYFDSIHKENKNQDKAFSEELIKALEAYFYLLFPGILK